MAGNQTAQVVKNIIFSSQHNHPTLFFFMEYLGLIISATAYFLNNRPEEVQAGSNTYSLVKLNNISKFYTKFADDMAVVSLMRQ